MSAEIMKTGSSEKLVSLPQAEKKVRFALDTDTIDEVVNEVMADKTTSQALGPNLTDRVSKSSGMSTIKKAVITLVVLLTLGGVATGVVLLAANGLLGTAIAVVLAVFTLVLGISIMLGISCFSGIALIRMGMNSATDALQNIADSA